MSRRRGTAVLTAIACAFAALAVALSGGAAVAPAGASVRYPQQCRDPYPETRNPSNPLMLAHPPGADPLRGANLFVNGPRHGDAAGAIVALLGRSPKEYSENYSWARLLRNLQSGPLHRTLVREPALEPDVARLEMIASRPEEQRFSLYSEGGGPGAIFGQVQKIVCHTMRADPGTIPIITTFFLYQDGYCETAPEILAYRSRFERQIDEMVKGIGNRPVVMLLEIDGIGASKCMQRNGGLSAWEGDLRYEVAATRSLPHAVVYVEAGYSDGNSPGYTARVLNAVGVHSIRGFFTNDTHNQWTIHEIHWGARVVALLGGHAHFIVNTATNGRGPLLNAHPSTEGVEYLCNAPDRGIGPPESTATGFPQVDGFLWTGVPGNSSGPCNGGPPSGTFWLERALGLAARAQAKLGPGFPNLPY